MLESISLKHRYPIERRDDFYEFFIVRKRAVETALLVCTPKMHEVDDVQPVTAAMIPVKPAGLRSG